MICKRVFYTGQVQGVGFRYTAVRLAKRYAVVGYVQNLDDGRVRLEAQGTADEVDALLADVASTMSSKITAIDMVDQPIVRARGDAEELEAFTVRY